MIMHFTVNSFNREISRLFDGYFEKDSLATSYIELLLLLQKEPELSQNVIAENMNLAASTITRFIRKLEKQNLVEKQKKGRSIEVQLTKKGREKCNDFQKKYDAATRELEEILGEKYVSTMEQLLEHGVEQLRKKDK